MIEISHDSVSKITIYPKFSGYDFAYFRILGDGLGNLLFPWARAVSISNTYGVPIIAPTWPQFKLGPILRNERDKRFYTDLFSHAEHYVTGSKKLNALMLLPKVTEDQFLSQSLSSDSGYVVYACGMEGLFSPIITEYELIRRELLAITKPKHKKGLGISQNSISVHVRLGDFTKPNNGNTDSIKAGASNTQLPIAWYKEMILRLRDVLGQDYPVIIWSDDDGERLKELTGMSNTRREFLGSSIADLIGMSSARVLVASGSTFSMWASYLGRMPVIWYPGQLKQRLYLENPDAEIEVSELDCLSLPSEFLSIKKSA
jgi:hypothetical protein